MAAVGLHRGPGHIIEFMSGELVEAIGCDHTGVPFTEAVPDEPDLLRALDTVYRTGRSVSLMTSLGPAWVLAIRELGMIVGVAVHLEPHAHLPQRMAEPVQLEQAG